MNKEVLRYLARSDYSYLRVIEKLLELNRVDVSSQKIVQSAVRYRKRYAAAFDLHEHQSAKRTCIMSNSRATHHHKDPIVTETERVDRGIRSLPPSLLRPFLKARMESIDTRPCLFSALVDRSVDLFMEGVAEGDSS